MLFAAKDPGPCPVCGAPAGACRAQPHAGPLQGVLTSDAFLGRPRREVTSRFRSRERVYAERDGQRVLLYPVGAPIPLLEAIRQGQVTVEALTDEFRASIAVHASPVRRPPIVVAAGAAPVVVEDLSGGPARLVEALVPTPEALVAQAVVRDEPAAAAEEGAQVEDAPEGAVPIPIERTGGQTLEELRAAVRERAGQKAPDTPPRDKQVKGGTVRKGGDR